MRRLTLAAAAIVAVAAIDWFASRGTAPETPPPSVAASDRAAPRSVGMLPQTAPLPMAFPADSASAASAAVALVAPTAAPLGSGETPDLRSDANGNLVADAHTRDELERVLALNGRSEALSLLQRLEASLPPTAYRQAVDAFYKYQNYAIAAAQLTPPSQPVADEAEASRQLDALHALRVEYFGAATAAAYFGEEEATARSLLATMRTNPEGGATLVERAERAQQQAQQATGSRP